MSQSKMPIEMNKQAPPSDNGWNELGRGLSHILQARILQKDVLKKLEQELEQHKLERIACLYTEPQPRLNISARLHLREVTQLLAAAPLTQLEALNSQAAATQSLAPQAVVLWFCLSSPRANELLELATAVAPLVYIAEWTVAERNLDYLASPLLYTAKLLSSTNALAEMYGFMRRGGVEGVLHRNAVLEWQHFRVTARMGAAPGNILLTRLEKIDATNFKQKNRKK